MKIFFIGTVEFSKNALEKLVELKAQVVGVATKSQSRINADFANLTPLCQSYNIPFKYVKDINAPHIIDWIDDLKPDVIFCFGWSSLIKEQLLNLCPLGVIGYHPAELPMNRGRHPIIWALTLGLSQTASTFFFMKKGADDGDILSQAIVPIEFVDDANSLYKKLTITALGQIELFFHSLADNTFTRIKQDHSLANNWRKRGVADGKIDFRMSSKTIYNLVRGLTKPYVGAHIEVKNKEIKVWSTAIGDNKDVNLEPGKILTVLKQKIEVKTSDSSIWILDHEFNTLPKVNEYL